MSSNISIRMLFIICGVFVLVVTLGMSIYTGKSFLNEIDDLAADNEFQRKSDVIVRLSNRFIFVQKYLTESQKHHRLAELKDAGIIAIYDSNRNVVWKSSNEDTIPESLLRSTSKIASVRVGESYIASIPIVIDAEISSLREYAAENFSDVISSPVHNNGPVGYSIVKRPYIRSLGISTRNRYLLLGTAIITSMVLLLSFIIYRMIGRPLTILKMRITNDEVDGIREELEGRSYAAEEINSLVSAYLNQHQSITMAKENLEEQVSQRTSELGKRTEELRQMAFRVTHDNEDVTKRIAAELHDDLCSIQISLKRKMESFLKKSANSEFSNHGDLAIENQLRDWIAMTDQADSVARNIIGRFRTVVTDYLGLEAGLRDAMMHTVEKNESLDSFFINRSSRLEQLDPIMHDELVKIVREAVRNVVAHSDATRLTVTIDDSEESVDIRVSDNGGGFDRNALPRSLGLQTMEQRAVYIHGSIDFVQTGKGTDVVVKVPFKSLTDDFTT